MRRALLAVVVTTIGLVLLLSFKPHDVTAVAQPPSALTQQDSGSGRQPSALTRSDGDGDEHGDEHGDDDGDEHGDDDGRGTVAAPTPTVKKSPSARSAAGGATGDVVDTRWGPVQVRIAVSGKKITGVDVVQYPDGNRRDREISAVALPTLKEETLSKQSADIDTVSGATYTSEGYIRSLQSAIDRAGL